MENRNTIKNRMKTIEETKQMASVMELSASAGIHRAQKAVKQCLPSFQAAEEGKTVFGFPPYTGGWEGESWAIVAGGDRGLAGGYYVRLFEGVPKGAKVIPLGKKTAEFAASRGFSLGTDRVCRLAEYNGIVQDLLEAFLGKTVAEIFMVTPTMSGEAQCKKLLPLPPAQGRMQYDPSAESAAKRFASFYLSAQIVYAVKQAGVCELAARREAMGAAANNAEEMLEQLTLAYHAARQAAITRELVEIVAGSEEI
ncbi:MAG: FoF1 ATP synthase subunit gamma [Clostridia bacterium]|nr:FoF1 ATP synthase subunit gamma [Clostridia bacterium]